MTTFLLAVIAGAALHALILIGRSFHRARRTISEAEQFQKARRATTPTDWRPL